MTRYFFDFRQGALCCPDTEGAEFPHVEQAYLEAFKAVQDMWTELLRKRQDPRRCVFEVRNEKGELLFVLPFQEVLDSCLDRQRVPVQNTLESAIESASRTKRVSDEFIEALHEVQKTLAHSRALLKVDV
jgi:hypothetical protein